MEVSSGREDSHGPASRARFARAVDAAHSLCDLLWEELHEQPGSAARSAELAGRIADLVSTVAFLAHGGDARSAPASTTREATRAAAASPPAVLIDERDEAPGAETWAGPGGGSENNGHAAPPAWLGLVRSALAGFERDRIPFAVLLIEVLDVVEPAGANEQLERAVARALGDIGPASMAPEDSYRHWLLVPRADRVGARVLAQRLAGASGSVEGLDRDGGRSDAADRYFAALSARGSRPRAGDAAAPARVLAGIAACPEDGCNVSDLVARAHIELAGARSASAPFEAVTEFV